MGEVGTCEDCSEWEEKMYWTHFRTMHFFVSLVGNFADELAIPKKFASHLKLPKAVSLKGPSGVTWNVGLVSNGDHLFFKNGWKEFVNNHSLEENDLLVFKYYGDSRFDVLMFDQRSSCERESSYFIRKCGHKKLEVGYQMTEKARDSSVEAIHATSDDGVGSGDKKFDVGCQTAEKSVDGSMEVVDVGLDDGIGSPSSKKPRSDDHVMPMPFVRRNVPRAKRKIRKVAKSVSPVTPKRKVTKKEPSTCTVEEKDSPDAEHNSISGSRNYKMLYVSNRRFITESEKQKAFQLANAASTKESFIVIMRPTHVYKRFYLNIPVDWASSRCSPVNQDMTLLYKENRWRVRYHHDKIRNCGGISSGWKDFVIENNIEEFDVCRFELASPPGLSITMKVSVFRVVEELTPMTRVTSALPLSQKPSETAN